MGNNPLGELYSFENRPPERCMAFRQIIAAPQLYPLIQIFQAGEAILVDFLHLSEVFPNQALALKVYFYRIAPGNIK
jgi:hypothetical protein